MKQTLWTFGCSWTYSEPHKKDLNLKFWPEYLSKELNYNLVNSAYGGKSIFESINDLNKNLPNIKKGDLIVFQFSYPDRLPLPFLPTITQRKTWSAKDLTNSHDVLVNYTFHSNEYFLTENFYTQEKIENYLNFVIDFREEILLLGFRNAIDIFDYIENVIGAKIKYWFIDVSYHLKGDFLRYKNLIATLWNSDRIITFPIKKFKEYPYDFNIQASNLVGLEKQRYSDNYLNYNSEHHELLKTDYHPNDDGQKTIFKCVLNSLDKTYPPFFMDIDMDKHVKTII